MPTPGSHPSREADEADRSLHAAAAGDAVLVVPPSSRCGKSAIVYRGQGWIPRFTLVFLAVQLALSVFSRSDYLFTSVARTGAGPMPSDVAQMASALFLPFWFWGAACGALSLAVLLRVVLHRANGDHRVHFAVHKDRWRGVDRQIARNHAERSRARGIRA